MVSATAVTTTSKQTNSKWMRIVKVENFLRPKSFLIVYKCLDGLDGLDGHRGGERSGWLAFSQLIRNEGGLGRSAAIAYTILK